jgi:hypothetical protein
MSIWLLQGHVPLRHGITADPVLVILTINVLVVFMAWYVMVLRDATSLRGPTPSNASSNDVAPLKTIKYKRHKNNWYIGSFMYPSVVVCCCV